MRTDIKLSNDRLDKPGEVTMEVSVTNLTGEPLTDLVVMDDTIGTIGTAASIEAQASQTFEKTFMVEDTTQYIFKTSAKLADGTEIQTQIPAQIQVRDTDEGMPAWQIGLIVVIIAIAAVGVALGFYITGKSAKAPRAGPQGSVRRRTASASVSTARTAGSARSVISARSRKNTAGRNVRPRRARPTTSSAGACR
jgi:hypothetical protein